MLSHDSGGMNTTPCRKSLCGAAFALALAFAPMLHAQVFTLKLGPTPPPVIHGITPVDCCFMRKAAITSVKEIAISEAALGQLSNAELKAFARRVIEDHTAANAQLLALARRKGTGFATNADSNLSDDWSRKTDDIDRRYVREIIADHLDAVDMFERASKSGDPDVAAFAQRTLATLQQHLMLAHDVKKTID
jgi:putative membrane protein